MSHAAAIAFFALFSLAPMLILIVVIASYALNSSEISHQVFAQMQKTLGSQAATAISTTVGTTTLSSWTQQATLISMLVTFIGASATFTEVRGALNTILSRADQPLVPMSKLTWQFFRARLVSGALVLGIGAILIASVIVESFLANAQWLKGIAIHPLIRLLQIDVATHFFLLGAALSLLLYVLPDIRVKRVSALAGGFLAAALFNLGKYGLAAYLAVAGTANAFGAAGAVVVTLMWLFYSAAVFLFGAEIVKAIEAENVV
jgi:membrane protein